MAPEDCGSRFEHDGDVACRPIEPAAPCAAGTMAVPGETSCAPVKACATGTWGGIPTDGEVIYVDDSASGAADGSQQAPFTTIQAAVDVANSGAVVAIAAGTYEEDVVIRGKAVSLWGTCPAEVVIASAGGATASIDLDASAASSEIHQLSITGGEMGLVGQDVEGLVIEGVWLHGLSDRGVMLLGGGEKATFRRVLVQDVVGHGIAAWGVDVDLSEVVVLDVAPNTDGDATGIEVSAPGQLVVTASRVERVGEAGVVVFDVEAQIEDLVVRDVGGAGATSFERCGIGAVSAGGDPLAHHISIRRSVIERAEAHGIQIFDYSADVAGIVVRDHLMSSDAWAGALTVYSGSPDALSPVQVRASLFEGNSYAQVVSWPGDLSLEGVVIRDGAPDPVVGLGEGVLVVGGHLTARGVQIEHSIFAGMQIGGAAIELQSIRVDDTVVAPNSIPPLAFGIVHYHDDHDPSLLGSGSMRDLHVTNSEVAGVAVAADATLERVLVERTRSNWSTDAFGDGFAVATFMEERPRVVVTARDIVVRDSARAGMASFAADLTIENVVLDCNEIHLVGEELFGEPYFLDNLGGVTCGCGDTAEVCQVLTSGLEPPLGF
jgi:hypothetical protein